MKRALILVFVCLAAFAQKRPFWAFQTPVKHVVPAISEAGNPIDAFVLAKLHAKGLDYAPAADHRTLIRRLYFDLTGLPPRPEDLKLTYDEAVEKLLASPQYGERWGRHWLDIVRFGETDGGEHNYERPQSWRYRDYVIDSFNSDKPYMQFVREQLAGDWIAPDDPKMVAATGFLVAGPWDQVQAEINKDKAMVMTQRMDELDDFVTTTFHTFQAMTVNCARCHDHKFDPIPARDYYKLTSVFQGVTYGNRSVATEAARAAYDAKALPLKKQLDDVKAQIAAIENPARNAVLERKYRAFDEVRKREPRRLTINPLYNHNWFAAVTAKHFRFVVTAQQGKGAPELAWLQVGSQRVEKWKGTAPATPEQPQIVEIDGGTVGDVAWAGNATVYRVEASDDGEQWTEVCNSLDHVGRSELELPTAPESEWIGAIDVAKRDALQKERMRIEAEMAAVPGPISVYGAKPATIQKAWLLDRGSVAKPTEEVHPGALTAITTLPPDFGGDGDDKARRLALADWITSPKNPLTARVIVNRVWQYHFGAGLVNTPSDFGVAGERPSHPELLDWLATSFIENGGSLKWLHRQILATRGYRQSSQFNAKAHEVDGANRLLWHMPLKRMDAETMRDSILIASGKLNLDARGGPGFVLQKRDDRGSFIYKTLGNDGPDVWRRAVYRFVVRGGERIMMDSFDCPDPAVATPQRSVSNSAVQALTLMNNEFVMRQAGLFAERGKDVPGMYRILLQRDATARELELAFQFLKTESLAAFARVLLNSNEFVYVP